LEFELESLEEERLSTVEELNIALRSKNVLAVIYLQKKLSYLNKRIEEIKRFLRIN
jgi:hypothetical protein